MSEDVGRMIDEVFKISTYILDNSSDIVRLVCVLCGAMAVASMGTLEADCPECDEEGAMQIRNEFQNT